MKHPPAWASEYQSKSIPIPVYPSGGGDDANNFTGRLANEIIAVTSPKSTLYVKSMQSWYDSRSHNEVASLSLFAALGNSVGTIGLAGMDRLLGLKATATLQALTAHFERSVFRDKTWVAVLENLNNSLTPTENIVARSAFISQSSAHFRFTLGVRLTSGMTIICDILLCNFAVTWRSLLFVLSLHYPGK